MRAPRITIAGSEISSEPASTLVKKVSTENLGPCVEPLAASTVCTGRGSSGASEGWWRTPCAGIFLSSTFVLDQAFPTVACKIGRQCALAGCGGGDLLGRDRHRPAALGDVLDGEHDLFGGGALLLGGDLHLAAHLGHRLHHL